MLPATGESSSLKISSSVVEVYVVILVLSLKSLGETVPVTSIVPEAKYISSWPLLIKVRLIKYDPAEEICKSSNVSCDSVKYSKSKPKE